jgi:multidrug efflux pump subunit AcrA (membrane-fusion protein)
MKMRIGNESDFDYLGQLDFLDNQMNPSTGTISLRVKFDNPKESGNVRALVPGGHGEICVPLSDLYDALLVPDEAIQFDLSREVLYVVNEKNIVVSKQIKKGDMHDGLRVIREGISPTDRVIIDGIMRVRPGVTVNPVDTEMPGTKNEKK